MGFMSSLGQFSSGVLALAFGSIRAWVYGPGQRVEFLRRSDGCDGTQLLAQKKPPCRSTVIGSHDLTILFGCIDVRAKCKQTSIIVPMLAKQMMSSDKSGEFPQQVQCTSRLCCSVLVHPVAAFCPCSGESNQNTLEKSNSCEKSNRTRKHRSNNHEELSPKAINLELQTLLTPHPAQYSLKLYTLNCAKPSPQTPNPSPTLSAEGLPNP